MLETAHIESRLDKLESSHRGGCALVIIWMLCLSLVYWTWGYKIPHETAAGKVRMPIDPFQHHTYTITDHRSNFVRFRDENGKYWSQSDDTFWFETSKP